MRKVKKSKSQQLLRKVEKSTLSAKSRKLEKSTRFAKSQKLFYFLTLCEKLYTISANNQQLQQLVESTRTFMGSFHQAWQLFVVLGIGEHVSVLGERVIDQLGATGWHACK